MRMASQFFMVAAALALSTAAFAAPGDRSTSSDGKRSPAPKVEGAVSVAPSLGTESAGSDEEVAPGGSPVSGLATVAYGARGAEPESLIGWDSRIKIFPKTYPSRAIVYIEYNGSHLCTGYLYSPSMVATAGHCVHTGGSSGSYRNTSGYRVFPARNGNKIPYGSCGVTRLNSVIGWTQNNDPKFDYGAMRLNCTVGNTVGWFGLYTPEPLNMPAIVQGYPGDKPKEMWSSADKIRAVSTEMIAYRADTVGGNSGSPVWHDRDEAQATTGAWAFGVHNYAVGVLGTNSNSAARLTAVRIQNYVNWRDN